MLNDYKRRQARFALCGLNCGLCPRYHTSGSSRCPGCGGDNFNCLHPTCAIITCAKKHHTVEYCCLCEEYPCVRYSKNSEIDSFITYQNVLKDFSHMRLVGELNYLDQLDRKIAILELLLNKYNDGRHKNFYCLAVNLLDLADIEELMDTIADDLPTLVVVECFKDLAIKRNIQLKLRRIGNVCVI